MNEMHKLGTTEGLPLGAQIVIESEDQISFSGTVVADHDVFQCDCCGKLLKVRNSDLITVIEK